MEKTRDSGTQTEAPGVVPYPVVHTAHKVERSIEIALPPHHVFNFWRDFSNLPRFMTHLDQVEIIDEKRSHWTWHLKSTGIDFEWDSEIIMEIPGKMISWQTLEGSDVNNAGSVWFMPIDEGRATEVRWQVAWDPPGGKIGLLFGKLLGEDPGHTMTEGLQRLREILESKQSARSNLS